MEQSIEKKVHEWLYGPYDQESKATILSLLKTDPDALTDAFYTDLSFGTGGLRGIMGPGTNRMNIYTVRRATQGFANYLLKNKGPSCSVFIGFDNRNASALFAQETASVLAANGIGVYLLKELRPTPFISFGCREKKCQGAIMITASHNPKEYNGYKVYLADGAQVVSPDDALIIDEVHKIKETHQIKVAGHDHPLISLIGQELDELYLKQIFPLQFFQETNTRKGQDLKITYTSLHGTGITLVPSALKSWGFSSICLVDPQVVVDGNFTHAPNPNPESPQALQIGIDYLVQTSSDLLLATDPDADRIGVVAVHEAKPYILTGNDIAVLCAYYICKTKSSRGESLSNYGIVSTIVSSELIQTITRAFGAQYFEVLTGFKYIGEKIREWENDKQAPSFLFGAEESYGYLIGTHSRDKDAIVLSCLISEMALQMKLKGKSLVDLLYEVYQQFGVHQSRSTSLSYPPSKKSEEKIQGVMDFFKTSPPSSVEGKKVQKIIDLNSDENKELPKADVLIMTLEEGTKFVIRPSGTEPKIKIYTSVRLSASSNVEDGLVECADKIRVMTQALLGVIPPALLP